MPLSRPPARLVEAGRVARFGQFAGPIADPNLADLAVYGPLGRLRFKEWQHVAVVHPELCVTFAIVNAGVQHLGWLQVVDRRRGAVVASWEERGLRLDLGIARALYDERTWLRSGPLDLAVHNHLAADAHTIRIRAPGLEADLVCAASVTPLVVCLPVGRGRAMYSHKVPLPVSGRVRWQGERFDLDPDATTAIFDIHKAHYPHHTWWHWATFAGHTDEGRRIAVNLTRNLIEDPAMHECAVWVDDTLSLLPRPTFTVGSADPWRATGDAVDLAFTGHGERREDVDVLGLVRSRFRQRFGVWSGRVGDHEVQDAWGLAEDHDARW